MGFLGDLLGGSSGTGAARAKQAQKLFAEDKKAAEEQRQRQMLSIQEMFAGMQQAKAFTMGSQGAAADAARRAQEKAMERVAAYSGGNPLAMSSAMAQLGTNTALQNVYAQGGQQLSGLVMQSEAQRAGLRAGAEGLYGQLRGQASAGEANVLSSIQDAQPGILGSLIGAAGSYFGMKHGAALLKGL